MGARSELEGLSPASVAALEDMARQCVGTTTVSVIPVAFIVFLILLNLTARALDLGFRRFSRLYPTLSLVHQRTCTCLVLNLLTMSAALAIQLAAAPVLARQPIQRDLDCIKTAAALITGFYLFELCYREGIPLVFYVHHVMTIFIVLWIVIMFEKEPNRPSLFVTAFLWEFQATTEQLLSVARLMHRLNVRASIQVPILRCSILFGFTTKFASSLYILIWWGLKQVRYSSTAMDIAFDVMVVGMTSALVSIQAYHYYGMWRLSTRVQQQAKVSSIMVVDVLNHTPYSSATTPALESDAESAMKEFTMMRA